MTFDAAALAAPFPGNAIHWRAQTLNKEGTSAMALAYIDARDVMERLDTVCGPANWQDSYAETPKGRLICTLSIRIEDEWISKSDGAGDTDVEGDKGAISDALKRAAVKWGVGRYLYDMPVTWADCESYEAGGKKRWRKWTDAGLRKLRAIRAPAPAVALPQSAEISADAARLIDGIEACHTIATLFEWKALNGAAVNASPNKRAIASAFAKRETALQQKAA